MVFKLKTKHMISRKRLFYTCILCVSLLILLISAINLLYRTEEKQCVEGIRQQASKIAANLKEQFESDNAYLNSLATLLADCEPEDVQPAVLVHQSHDIGMLNRLQLLFPDGTLITENGSFNVSDKISFDDEKLKKSHITGLTDDLIIPSERVIRNACPIVNNGEVTAILYGIIDPDDLSLYMSGLKNTYITDVYLIDAESGDYIVDTLHNRLSNVRNYTDRSIKPGFSWEDFLKDFKNGSGYTEFHAPIKDDYFYMAFEPAGINDWRVCVTIPKSIAFARAFQLRTRLIYIIIATTVIMGVYLISFTYEERKTSKRRMYASEIRKLLLQITNDDKLIHDSLMCIVDFSDAKRAFFLDSESGIYCLSASRPDSPEITPESRSLFRAIIFKIAAKSNMEIIEMKANKQLAAMDSEIYEFMNTYTIKQISFVSVRDKNGHFTVLGVINPKNKDSGKLLEDVSPCFAIAIENRKHLIATTNEVVTDPLTGLFNRAGFRRDLNSLQEKLPENFGCVYVDVNELHSYNNTYGHEAGDAMLRRIAQVLKEKFEEFPVYRIGGDEFMIFTTGISENEIQARMSDAQNIIKADGYHISPGAVFNPEGGDIDDLIKIAERRMMNKKAEYYQAKADEIIAKTDSKPVDIVETGNYELDSCLSVLGMHYLAIYFVSLDNDSFVQLLGSYQLNEYIKKHCFLDAMRHYVRDLVKPQYGRRFSSILDRNTLLHQLSKGHPTTIAYTKNDCERVLLNIYPIENKNGDVKDSVWVFERQSA